MNFLSSTKIPLVQHFRSRSIGEWERNENVKIVEIVFPLLQLSRRVELMASGKFRALSLALSTWYILRRQTMTASTVELRRVEWKLQYLCARHFSYVHDGEKKKNCAEIPNTWVFLIPPLYTVHFISGGGESQQTKWEKKNSEHSERMEEREQKIFSNSIKTCCYHFPLFFFRENCVLAWWNSQK